MHVSMGKRKKRYHRDEALYNLVQENEMPMFFACLQPVIAAILDRESLWHGVGRPPLKLKDVLVCLTVKEYFDKSLRRAVGLLRVYKRANLIDVDIPCFKTLDNYLNNSEIHVYVERLIELTSALFSEVEKCVATDATGISTTCYSSWFSIQVRRKARRRDHIRVHITVGTKSNVVLALDIRGKGGGDNEIFRSHVLSVDERFDVDEWSADRLYLSRKNCDAVAAIGAEPWIKLKSNTTARAEGSTNWRRMVLAFKVTPDVANEKYHKRSNVESTFSAKKRKFGSSVRRRLLTSQKMEESFSWVGFNMSLIPRARYEFGVNPPIGH
jgi:transposase